MTKLSGSCLCGQLSYAGDTDIMGVVNCHCTDCQKALGAMNSTNMFVKAADITVTGDTLEFDHQADSGSTLTKINCAKCGSPTLGRNSAREGMLVIRTGTLDQKDLIVPKATVFASSKVPSAPLDDSLKIFDKMMS